MERIEDRLLEEETDDKYLYDCEDEIAAAQWREWLAYQDYCEGKQG